MDILPQLIINALITGSIYALASAGLAVAYGLLRILNFAHGHFMMVGAYMFFAAGVTAGLPLPLALLITVIGSAIFGALVLMVFVEPFIKFNPLLVFVTTLALATMCESVVSMIFGVNVKSLDPGAGVNSIEFYGIYITPIQITIIVSAVVLLGFLGFVVHLSSVGRRLRALSEHSAGAESVGINRRKVTTVTFVIATILASYAGILVGLETNLQPTMGNTYTIKAFAAMVLGGLGNMWGTVVGAYLLGLVENLSIGLDFGPYSLPAGYKDAFAFVIILLVLLFKPSGLFVKKSRSV